LKKLAEMLTNVSEELAEVLAKVSGVSGFATSILAKINKIRGLCIAN
jgi:hypothetical protein